MNKKQIQRGKIYAWSTERSEFAHSQPILILDLDTDFPNLYKGALRAGTHKGILGVFVDELTLADPGETNYRRSPIGTLTLSFTHRSVGRIGEVEPRHLKRNWLSQVEIDGYAEAERRALAVAADEREAAQQKLIDEIYAIVPPHAWPERLLRPGQTPRLTVPEILAIAKAARTESLAEIEGTGGRFERTP